MLQRSSRDLVSFRRAIPPRPSIPLHSFRRVKYLHSTPPPAQLSSPLENGASTVNADEIAHFSRLSSLWWDERGEFGMLHKMNPVRMQFIKEKLVSFVVLCYDNRV